MPLLPSDCAKVVAESVISVGASFTGTTVMALLIFGAMVLLLAPESVSCVSVTVRVALPGLSLLLPYVMPDNRLPMSLLLSVAPVMLTVAIPPLRLTLAEP